MASGETRSDHLEPAGSAAECAAESACPVADRPERQDLGRVIDMGEPEETPESLLCACVNLGDWQAWDRFILTFHRLIVATVLRTARSHGVMSPDLRDDLVQDVYLKLSAHRAKVLREFTPRHTGSAFGYIKVITACVVHDYFKGKGVRTPWEQAVRPDTGGPPDPMEWAMLVRDMDDILRRDGAERDRQIFWLYYRQGMSAKEIAALPAFELTVEGVESVLGRTSKLVREAFRSWGRN